MFGNTTTCFLGMVFKNTLCKYLSRVCNSLILGLDYLSAIWCGEENRCSWYSCFCVDFEFCYFDIGLLLSLLHLYYSPLYLIYALFGVLVAASVRRFVSDLIVFYCLNYCLSGVRVLLLLSGIVHQKQTSPSAATYPTVPIATLNILHILPCALCGLIKHLLSDTIQTQETHHDISSFILQCQRIQ